MTPAAVFSDYKEKTDTIIAALSYLSFFAICL